MSQTLDLNATWTLQDLNAVAKQKAVLRLPSDCLEKVRSSRAFVEKVAADNDHPVYGINTGFGALAETAISAGDLKTLQRNLIRSHACGVGPLLSAEVVRVMLALRAHTLCMGVSGVRAKVIELLVQLYANDLLPCIPAQGSVGASGDLAPLAHLALVLMGEGEAMLNGKRLSAKEALARTGLEAIELQAKEGLALINGTQMMAALGGLALADALVLLDSADVVGAMSLEAYRGSKRPFDPRLHDVRPHPGQICSAAHLRALLESSEIMESHRDCDKVQDPYSFRCMPQVHGASRDALSYACAVTEREINSATDNPLIFIDEKGQGDAISGGNFHGQPLALAFDTACMAVAELANISERRIEQLVNPALGSGLPAFLAGKVGLESGFMIAQVAAASLVSENKVLCHPASVDSIPSSAGKEDHVSMGSISARKFAQVLEHTQKVLAIEALVAAQGLDLRKPLKAGRGVSKAHESLREHVQGLKGDRPLYRDIETATQWLRNHGASHVLS
ncbi:MAG: histidine ammonia-lyase [Myxococcales bacterium]|nr:MAG: histidine ammonia-lyase [Myxococcales bacterium]